MLNGLRGVTECVKVCTHGALRWTGIPCRIYYRLAPSVPGISSESTTTQTRIKWLLKMNE